MYKNPDLSSQSETTDYIRFVLNNAPVSAKGLCIDAVNGFCRMDEFLKKAPGLDKEAMYQEACFGDYNITTQVANGQPVQ
jgi:3-phytase